MSPQVTAALVSGGAALVVALLGIAGAIVAQLVVTRRSFANSLALFEREYAKRERERVEQARREDDYRYAEQRRSTYARMLRAAAALYLASLVFAGAAEAWRYVRDPEMTDEPPELRAKAEEKRLGLLHDAHRRWERAIDELEEAVDEIELLASADVRHAAHDLARVASQEPDLGDEPLPVPRLHPNLLRPRSPREGKRWIGSYWEARDEFLDAARHELGILAASAPDSMPSAHRAQP